MSRPPAKSEAMAAKIADDIADKRPGEWLAGRRALAGHYRVSEDLISRALRVLAARGLIEFVPGQGHRIPAPLPDPVRRMSSDQMQVVDKWRGWHAICLAHGKEPWTESTPRETPIPSHAAIQLGVPFGTVVVERARTQGWMEGDWRRPVVLSWTWIKPDVVAALPVLKEINTGPGGITSRMQDAGMRLWWEDVVRAKAADAFDAHRLEVPEGSPLIDVWRRCYEIRERTTDVDRVVEATRRVIRTDLHELVYRYP